MVALGDEHGASELAGDMEQSEIIAFLSDPRSYPGRPERVDRVDTHGAIVFLAGDEVVKIKRQVRFPYMDFSTLALRRRACEREIEVNQFARQVYLGVVAIMRGDDGRLQLGGEGEPVEWAVHMRRFPEACVLARMAERGEIDLDLVDRLAGELVAMHAAAPPPAAGVVPRALSQTADDLIEGLAAGALAFDRRQVEALRMGFDRELCRCRHVLRLRRHCGRVRRCHGDLHLGNIVLLDSRPLPFDALEFDESLASIDTLYDLAFLLMDLAHRGLGAAANHLLNRYLQLTGDALDVLGLRAMPLMLALRAGIRAMVTAQRNLTAPGNADRRATAQSYLDLALTLVAPVPPRLVAIGGFSGTGKTTLARTLAPELGRSPGALHLRSDIERKRLAGAGDLDRLGEAYYGPEQSAQVYARLVRKTRLAIRAGAAVVVDAVFARPSERAEIEAVARRLGVPFDGLWLTSDDATLRQRVQARTGDASDATPEVVSQQIDRGTGALAWRQIDASGSAAATAALARHRLGLDPG